MFVMQSNAGFGTPTPAQVVAAWTRRLVGKKPTRTLTHETPHAGFGYNIFGDTAEEVAVRIQNIKAKMLSVGIPTAIGSGIGTMFTFAAAFGLAGTERVWMPSLWLGAVTALGGLITVAVAAKAAADAETAKITPGVAVAPAAQAPAQFAQAAFVSMF